MELKVVLLISLLCISALGQEVEKSPEKEPKNERNSKQLWPVMTSYFYPYQRSPQYVPSIPTLLSATNLFSKYTKSVGPKQSHQYLSNTLGNQEWSYRVRETELDPLTLLASSADGKQNSASQSYQIIQVLFADSANLTQVKSDDDSDDMQPSESVNYLAATGRQSPFELNGSGLNGFENDVVPLDFPGIQAGDRNFTSSSSTENTLNTAQVVTISGVGRPVSVPSSVPKPQGSHFLQFLFKSISILQYFSANFDPFQNAASLSFWMVRPITLTNLCAKSLASIVLCTVRSTGIRITQLEIVGILMNMEPLVPIFGIQGKQKNEKNRCWILIFLPFRHSYGWVVGVGKYIGQTKGVMFTRNTGNCPTETTDWRYLDQNLSWQDNGNIYVKCAS